MSGKRSNQVYSSPPVKRTCECDKPRFYTDDDGDDLCAKCGRPEVSPVPPDIPLDSRGRRVSKIL